MRLLATLIIAVIAFVAGMWYSGRFDVAKFPNTNTPATNTPPTAPAPAATYTNADADTIQITTPQPGAVVASTFTVSGKARGGWYFEASFPYEVHDANGRKIAEGPIQAQGEWMTPEFVPFTIALTVPNYKGKATLILHNDNPSGLPENAASVSIPIVIQ